MIPRLISRSPLYNLYKNLNPVIGNFAGYQMPMNFKINSSKDVVCGIRNGYTGVFDISHMGVIKISNKYNKNDDKNIKTLLESLFPINLNVLKENDSKLSLLLNRDGFVVDDLIVSNLSNKYRLIVNSETKHNIFKMLNNFKDNSIRVELQDKVILSIQGEKSQQLLEEFFDVNLDNIYFNQNVEVDINPKYNPIEISRTGYTGEDGFELYCDIEYGQELYEQLIKLRTEKNLLFGGLIDRDILRTEAGFCLSGKDFGSNLNINYLDLNMNFLIGKRRKEQGNFIGHEHIKNHKYNRYGFTCNKPLRDRDIIYETKTDKNIGIITSGTKSYNIDKFVGMGYLDKNIDLENIYVKRNNKILDLSITNIPFIKHNLYKNT